MHFCVCASLATLINLPSDDGDLINFDDKLHIRITSHRNLSFFLYFVIILSYETIIKCYTYKKAKLKKNKLINLNINDKL